MTVAKILIAVLVLWLPITLLTMLSVPVALVAIARGHESYALDIMRAQDRLVSALFGWDGRHTVSAHCGGPRAGCRFCRWLCSILGAVLPGHCAEAAREERLAS